MISGSVEFESVILKSSGGKHVVNRYPICLESNGRIMPKKWLLHSNFSTWTLELTSSAVIQSFGLLGRDSS